jgi:hypothetical protein
MKAAALWFVLWFGGVVVVLTWDEAGDRVGPVGVLIWLFVSGGIAYAATHRRGGDDAELRRQRDTAHELCSGTGKANPEL